MSVDNAHEILYEALAEAVTVTRNPGAVAYVGDRRETRFFEAVGQRQTEPEPLRAERDTVYDLASITKCVATATAIMLLRDDGLLELDQPVTDFLPVSAYNDVTLRHLLTHTAGLVPGRAYYRDSDSFEDMLERYATLGLENPPGTRRRYSDVGYMILGEVAGLVARDSLDAFCRERIYAPLGMADTDFRPQGDLAARAAATERCAWRGKIIQGVVHDENAYALGGVAGHAGLFSTAEDLARFCRGLLNGEVLHPDTVAEMIAPGQAPSYPTQGLGWQLNSWSESTQGYLPARMAFGHTGWTGTSLWMDWESGLFAILLGNTCHPSRNSRRNGEFRQTFYAAVAEAEYPTHRAVHTGLDRLVWDSFAPLRGRRFALLTHYAAVDAHGRPVLDVLDLEPSLELARLYSPEHGFRGQAEAGEHVNTEANGETPIVSLYGDRRRPSQSELRDIDLFVVDLVDVGSRYYTYIATMKDCMAACAEAGVPVLVLDRPNPVGGAVLEGPVAEEIGSLVCYAHIPVRHGMTMGETAQYFARYELTSPRPSVSVHRLDNWRRDMYFDECALPWEPPSPNMPSPETALLYVGTCLFEGLNVNEGRGTDEPFHVFGAPWMDAEEVLWQILPEEQDGVSIVTTDYIPVSLPGRASSPRYMNETCHGLRIRVQDKRRARPFTLALALINAIRKRHPQEVEWRPIFDLLAGGPDVRRRLERGEPALELAASWEAELEAFREKMPQLYS